ncbi:MAG: hypothetical protein H0U37_02980 [Chloroflexi bacterium]|nr:hypothetical protein [Chloroflexota bacterium]
MILLFVGVKVARTALRAAGYPGSWHARMREPVPAGAIRLVALGDSSVLAVGADDPMEGFVGRIATYITERTGRPVHIANVSSGGTTADVVRDQLPQVDLARADIVIVADSNDLESGVSLEDYRAVLTTLVAVLPVDRTIYSDLPLLPGRDAYQAVLQQVTDSRGIPRADFAAISGGEGRRLDIFSWLPVGVENPHSFTRRRATRSPTRTFRGPARQAEPRRRPATPSRERARWRESREITTRDPFGFASARRWSKAVPTSLFAT